MQTQIEIETEFVQFWAAYPKKRNKKDALKAFAQARREGATLNMMLAALEWQRNQRQWVRDGGQFIPFPASWIRAGAYEDEPDEPVVLPAKEYWADICQREHGGTCVNRWSHEMKIREAS
jgi:hypothetical protein